MNKSIGQITVGLLIVAVGIGLFLNALEVINFKDIISNWWPVAIIVVGFAGIASNPRQFMWPAGIVVLGILLLLQRHDIITINIGALIWPAIITSIGLAVLFDKTGRGSKRNNVNQDKLQLSAIFSGNEARSVSQNFQGGEITAIFGGVDIDLRDVKINKEATLEVFTLCGGIEIKVPEGWIVNVTGLPLLGGWENKTRRPLEGKNAPVLNVSGTCIMGGVSIKD